MSVFERFGWILIEPVIFYSEMLVSEKKAAQAILCITTEVKNTKNILNHKSYLHKSHFKFIYEIPQMRSREKTY